MEITGTIKVINDTQSIGANNFRKREFVIATDEQFSQEILIEAAQDKCDILNSYSIGQNVKVSINLRGRSWVNPQGETKYFNSIQMWRIEREGGQTQQQAPAQQQQPYNAPQTTEYREEDDLPF